jgi:small-conductance mechanosensitive channel
MDNLPSRLMPEHLLLFRVRDPQNGVSNVKSVILLDLWDKFAESDIEIPFPQRDLHLRSVAPGIQWPEPVATG